MREGKADFELILTAHDDMLRQSYAFSPILLRLRIKKEDNLVSVVDLIHQPILQRFRWLCSCHVTPPPIMPLFRREGWLHRRLYLMDVAMSGPVKSGQIRSSQTMSCGNLEVDVHAYKPRTGSVVTSPHHLIIPSCHTTSYHVTMKDVSKTKWRRRWRRRKKDRSAYRMLRRRVAPCCIGSSHTTIDRIVPCRQSNVNFNGHKQSKRNNVMPLHRAGSRQDTLRWASHVRSEI